MTAPLWTPSPERVAAANMTAFMRQVEAEHSAPVADCAALYRWSVAEPEKFWRAVWSFSDVIAETQGDVVLEDGDKMPGARFFPEARLNYAENLLRRRDSETAIVFHCEDRERRSLSFTELYDSVSVLARALAAAGVAPGDRVAGYLPNAPETVVAMLAAASLGAIWSSCSPDFGVEGVLDRFGQIAPKVLFAADGYFYNARHIDLHDRLEAHCRRVAGDDAPDRGALRRGCAAARRPRRRGRAARVHRRVHARRHRVSPTSVQSSALHHVLLGHHRRPQVHRPRRRRDAVEAPVRAAPSHRSQTWRPPVLRDHVRLDDVELAGQRSGFGGDALVVRRGAVSPPTRTRCSLSPRPRR